MAKIPVKPVIDVAKLYGPKVIKFAEDHKGMAPIVMPIISTATRKAKEFQAQRKINKVENNTDHIRKKRFIDYKKIDLNQQNKSQLTKSIHEIENFISQIKYEEEQELAIKKPLHSKRTKDWNSLLTQIKDQMAIRDYQEYLLLFNNPTYKSEYFEGFDRLVERYKKIFKDNSSEKLYNFIHTQTNRDLSIIKKDFL